ncbi:MAG: HTTM domain-containing protein [Verrucomicrobiota bacterium]
MSVTPFSLRKLGALWERFFFQPADLSMCGLIRIGYSVLLLINVLILAPDLTGWFGEQGVLPFAVSRQVVDPDTTTLFAWLPKSNAVVWTCYCVLLAQIVALLVGWFARFQALSIFIWLASFHHRNTLIWDGEDCVFRLLAFYLIFLPIGDFYSLCGRNRKQLIQPEFAPNPVWPLRLVQIQITLIYVSNVWEKLNGSDWLDGISIYYVSRLDDSFGRFPLPGFLFQSLAAIKLMTWSVLVIECLVPIGLWFKETRRAALLLAVGFHLATDYAMNLLLFHPIMLVGLLAFVDPAGPRKMLERWRPPVRSPAED